jgi:hypothetical protein
MWYIVRNIRLITEIVTVIVWNKIKSNEIGYIVIVVENGIILNVKGL